MSRDKARIESALGDKYEIKGHISSGGMGDIYLGIHRALERRVAIKIVHEELSKDEEFRQRFYREAKLASHLDHPAIIEIYDFGTVGDLEYIIMPYIEGSTLQQRVREKGSLGLEESLRLMIILTDAVAYAHSNNVVHRDIKLSNIMMDCRGRIILTDFGISKDLGDLGLTLPQQVLGSPKYMSPEQIKGQEVDGRSDVYSLGLVFYEIITGRHPFEGKDTNSMYYCQVHEMPPKPEGFGSDVPEKLSEIIMKMLEKSPERRYQSGEELLKDLEQYSSRLSVDQRKDVQATVVSSESFPRRKRMGPAGPFQRSLPQLKRLRHIGGGISKQIERFIRDKKRYRWAVPGLGIVLLLVAGLVWIILPSPTEKITPPPPEEKIPFNELVKALFALGQGEEGAVELWTDKPTFHIGDSISYHFRSQTASYVTVVILTSGGELVQLFPNRFTPSQLVEAARKYTIPEETTDLTFKVTGPLGREEIVAFTADGPFDLLSASFADLSFFRVDKENDLLLKRIRQNIEAIDNSGVAQKRTTYRIVD
jgi:serine/threonine protein kinase